MSFQTIEHIDEIMPHLAGRTDFIVRERAGYTVIDYVYAVPDSFDEPLRRECRGIKFAPDGKLLARPFHKFFNLGEKPETQPGCIDVGLPHVVMDKLDGSMIHPALVGERLAFMTRMGETDVAAAALKYAEAYAPAVLAFCREQIADGLTPIFEYTAPTNRIVVRYHEPALTLLAIRENYTGRYLPLRGINTVPVVPHGDAITDLDRFVAAARGLRDVEGYVIRFDNGLMLKLKADDYVLRHKAKDGIGLEKNALRVVLENADDDMLKLLPDDDAAALSKYAAAVRAAIGVSIGRVADVLEAGRAADRKTFAVEYAPRLPQFLRSAAFNGYQGGDIGENVVKYLLKQAGTGTRIEAIREEAGLPDWSDYYQMRTE